MRYFLFTLTLLLFQLNGYPQKNILTTAQKDLLISGNDSTKLDSITRVLFDKFAADSFQISSIETKADKKTFNTLCLKVYFPYNRVQYVLDPDYMSLIVLEYFKLSGKDYNKDFDYLKVISTTIFSKNENIFEVKPFNTSEQCITVVDSLFPYLMSMKLNKINSFVDQNLITVNAVNQFSKNLNDIDSLNGRIKYYDLVGIFFVSEDSMYNDYTVLKYKIVYDDNSMKKFTFHVRRNDFKIQFINLSKFKSEEDSQSSKPIREPYTITQGDDIIKVLPDPNFLGTDDQLRYEIEQGNLEMYYVKSDDGNFLIERIRKKENKDSFPVTLWSIIIILIPFIWYITKTKNKERIKEYFTNRDFEIIYEDWDPFAGESWFGERNIANYRILYYDRERKVHEAIVKTGFFYGVYVTEDHLIDNIYETEKIVKLSAIQSKEEKINLLQNEIELLKENLDKEESENTSEDKIFKKEVYKCSEGELQIEQEFFKPNVGEKAYLNGEVAPDGIYKLGFMNYVIIEEGLVIKLATSKED